jgi:hypothetical protein
VIRGGGKGEGDVRVVVGGVGAYTAQRNTYAPITSYDFVTDCFLSIDGANWLTMSTRRQRGEHSRVLYDLYI